MAEDLNKRLSRTNPANDQSGTWTRGLQIASPALQPQGDAASCEGRNSILITRHYPDLSIVLLIGRAAWSVWNVCARFSDVMWQGYQYSFLDTYINVKNDYLDEMNELEFNLQNHRQRFQASITGRILDFLTWVPDSKA